MTKNSTDIVLDAVIDLHNQEQIVTRETLSSILDLKLAIIDDRLSYLIDTDRIKRVQRGVFVPVIRHPPARIVSKMILPDGTVKVEIGDDVITLTPREARYLGNLMAADAMQYSNIELGHHMALIQTDIAGQIRKLSNNVERLNKSNEQPDLLNGQN